MNGTSPWPLPVLNVPPDYCYPPLGLSVSIAGSIVTFSWQVPHDNEGLVLSYWKDGSAATPVNVSGTNARLILEVLTHYNWSLSMVCDQTLNRSSIEVLGAPFTTGDMSATIPCPIVNLDTAIVLIAGNTARLQWDAIAGIQYYDVYIQKVGASFSVVFNTSTNYLNYSFLESLSTYEWQVRPICTGSVFSAKKYFTTTIESLYKPLALTAKIDITSVMLFWTINSNLEGVDIYLNSEFVVSINDPAANMIVLSGLLPATNYSISVVPKYNGNQGNISYINITTLGVPVNMPQNLTANIVNENIVISWDSPAGIDGSYITINGSGLIAASPYIFAGAPGTKYYISVRSIYGGLYSKPAVTSITTGSYIQSPQGLYIKSLSYNKVLIGWLHSSGADSYSITYRKLSSHAPSLKVLTDQTVYLIEGLDASSLYIAEVRSISQGIESLPSALTINMPVKPAGAIPDNIQAINITDSSFMVIYQIDPGATDNFFKIGVFDLATMALVSSVITTGPFVTIAGLSAATPYTFTVFNIWNPDNVVESEVHVVTTYATCIPPGGIDAIITGGNTLTVTWTDVGDSDHYTVEVRIAGTSNWMFLPVDSPGVALLFDIAPAIYEVRITNYYNNAVLPPYTNGGVCSTTTFSSIPQVLNVTAQVEGSTARFTWDIIPGADYYKVFINNGMATIRTSTVNSLALQLEDDTNYTVQVQAIFNSLVGPSSDVISFITACTIEQEVDCVKPEFEALWQNSNINNPAITPETYIDVIVNITNFDRSFNYIVNIYYGLSEIPTAGKVINTGDDSSKGSIVFMQQPFGSLYRATVTAYVGANKYCSDSKDVMFIMRPSPTSMTFDSIGDRSVHASWTPPEGRMPILYDVYLDGVLYGETTCTDIIISGLSPLTSYTVSVKAKYATDIYSDSTSGVATTVDTLP